MIKKATKKVAWRQRLMRSTSCIQILYPSHKILMAQYQVKRVNHFCVYLLLHSSIFNVLSDGFVASLNQFFESYHQYLFQHQDCENIKSARSIFKVQDSIILVIIYQMFLEQKLPSSSFIKKNMPKDCLQMLREEERFDWRERAYDGQSVYILSELSFQTIKTIIVDSIFFTTTVINASIVQDQEEIIYSHYDHILKDGVGEEATDQSLKIRIISPRMNQLIFQKLRCSGFQFQRKVLRRQGQFQVELYPYSVECSLITSLIIKNNPQTRDARNKVSLKMPQMDKFRFNFFQSETMHDLKTKLKQRLQPDWRVKALQIFAYDQSLFQIVPISRYIEYFILKEDIEHCSNVRQRKFYELIFKRDNDQFLVEFFPGKLLTDQSHKYLAQNKIKKLIVDGYVDQKWVFPAEQPAYSVAKDCSFCVLKSQLYLLFDCQHCGNSLMFCSRVCQYQGLLEHPCPQGKQQLMRLYGDQSVKDLNQSQPVREIVKKDNKKQKTSNFNYTSKIQKPLFYFSNENNSLPQFLKTGDKQEAFLPRGGLYNLGNTCYMNAAIQSLAYTSLTPYLMGLKATLKDSRLAKAYTHLLNLLQKTQANSFLSYQKVQQFKYTLDNQINDFQGSRQHDAHEFMTVFIDKLRSELNTKSNVGGQEPQLRASKDLDESEGQRQWLRYITSNGHSPILHLFYGQLKSEINCPHCHHSSKQFTTFNILQLSIPNRFDEITISLYYEYYQFRQKTKQITINLSKALLLDDLLVVVGAKLKLQQGENKKVLRVFLLSFQGVTVSYGEQVKIEKVEEVVGALKSKENQLFIVETVPQKNVFLVFKFMRTDKQPFTFKRPLFFNLSVDKITNVMLYSASIQYLFAFAKLYHRFNITYKEKVKGNITEYIKLSLHYFSGQDDSSSDFKGKGKDIGNDSDITKQLGLEGYEVWVELQKFNRSGDQLDSKFYNSITGKMSNCIVYKEIQTDQFNRYSQVIQLQKCIEEQLSRKELLGKGNEWLCPTCKQKRRVYKSTYLYKTPQYLIVHLKRFMKRANENIFQKNNCKIKTPLILNLGSVLKNHALPEKYYTWCTPQQTKIYELSNIQPNTSQSCRYELKSVILHNGTLESGHYIALVCAGDRSWREYNDKDVTQVDINKLLNQSQIMQRVYLLIYQRMEQ